MEFIESGLLEDVVNHLSKHGEIEPKEELQLLAEHADLEQKILLYSYFREESGRWEQEWRAEFCEVFIVIQKELPRPMPESKWGSRIITLVKGGDLSKVKAFSESTGQLEATDTPEQALKEGQKMGFQKCAEFVPFSFYPFEEYVDGEVSLVELARSRNYNEIGDYLEGIIETLSQRWKDAYLKGYLDLIADRQSITCEIGANGEYFIEQKLVDLDSIEKVAVQAKQSGINHLQVNDPHSHGLGLVLPVSLIFDRLGITNWDVDYSPAD